MTTLRLGPGDLERAAAILRGGGLVAFPTETVYGLGADATNAAAVARIFRAKGRPADNPLIVHLADAAELGTIAEGGSPLASLWPGPLTLILRRRGAVCDLAAAGLDTVAVRVPGHALARALIAAAGCPVAAPSANRSGRPSPTTAAAVLEDLDGRIDAVLDGGPTDVGVESTVVDVTETPTRVLRLGGMPLETLRVLAPDIALGGDARRSPGTRYRHYAPQAPVVLAPGDEVAGMLARDPGASALVTDETASRLPPELAARVVRLGPAADAASHARRLFDMLRRLDRARPSVIVAEILPEAGLDRAVMDRLRRAATGGERP
jgi:L-threonylcarbamoyladenylate synthase